MSPALCLSQYLIRSVVVRMKATPAESVEMIEEHNKMERHFFDKDAYMLQPIHSWHDGVPFVKLNRFCN